MLITAIELRKVNLLFDCENNLYEDITVSVLRDEKSISIVNQLCVYIGDVEYNDGSFLSVYDFAGSFVGFEYDSDCNLIKVA